jgi:hypothetical protein
MPITLTLKAGSAEVDYAVVNTDARGYFTVSLGSVPSGVYTWRVKGPKYLANASTISLLRAPDAQSLKDADSSNAVPSPSQPTAPNVNVEMGMMLTGDANNDNIVNALDFVIVKSSYGKSAGLPGYDDRADFTGDGVVNVLDFNIVKANFGSMGAPPI